MTETTPGKALLIHVRKILDERWPMRDVPGHAKPPEGLRLELHPLAANHLFTDSSLGWKYSDGSPSEQLAAADKFGLPVKILGLDLEPGAWRLVIVTEEVLDGGRMPDGTPGHNEMEPSPHVR
jgi:hypothetical protein